jgi:hypothetical protein
VSTVEEIERAVKKLPQSDFVKLAAWMDHHQASVGAKPDAGWFEIYMACPHPFKISPRKKERPGLRVFNPFASPI